MSTNKRVKINVNVYNILIFYFFKLIQKNIYRERLQSKQAPHVK